MTESKKRRLVDELRVRVNPEYDHEVDPVENPYEYWNPVTATNDLVKLANATIEITQVIADAMRERTRAELSLRKVNRELEVLEHSLLVDHPLSPTEAKTLKTVAAAVQSRVYTAGIVAEFQTLRTLQAQQEDLLLTLQERIDVGHAWNKATERVSDNLKTALAFYKDERKRAYQH
jgi:hypothetical protein